MVETCKYSIVSFLHVAGKCGRVKVFVIVHVHRRPGSPLVDEASAERSLRFANTISAELEEALFAPVASPRVPDDPVLAAVTTAVDELSLCSLDRLRVLISSLHFVAEWVHDKILRLMKPGVIILCLNLLFIVSSVHSVADDKNAMVHFSALVGALEVLLSEDSTFVAAQFATSLDR